MINANTSTKYFILDPNAALPSANTRLYNDSTTVPNIPVNSGGFYKPVAGSGNHNEINAAPGNAMQFIYRRNTANDKAPLYNRPWEESSWINAFCSAGFITDQKNAAFGSNDSHLIGAASGAGLIIPYDVTTYQIQVSGHGDRTDWFNGGYNTPTTFGFYTTPDFSLGSLTTAQQRDTIIAELAMDFNNKSRNMSFVIALDSAGGATTGSHLVSALATTAVGTNIIIGYDRTGATHSFVMTLGMQRSFVALGAAGYGSARLKPYAVAGASNIPAGVPLAGTTNVCDLLYFMAVDEGQAYHDFRPSTKRRIEVGLVSGLDNVPQTRISVGSEGSGYGHQLKIEYRKHNQYVERHNASMPYNSYHVEFPNAFKEDAFYDYFVIEHCDQRTATSGMPTTNMSTTIIAVVNTTIGNSTTNPYFGNATAAAQRAYLVASLNAFNSDNSLGQATLV